MDISSTNGEGLLVGRWLKALLAIPIVYLFFLQPVGVRAETCPNESFRVGPSTDLPDCRAYELVTPPDANGRLLEALRSWGTIGYFPDMFPTEMASPQRDSFVYSTFNTPLLRPIGSNGVVDIYQAERQATGWATTRRITPSGEQAVLPTPGGVSADHRYSFAIVDEQVPGVPVGSLAGETSRDFLLKPDGSIELTGIGSEGEEPLAQGRYISPDGQHVIFTTGRASEIVEGRALFQSERCASSVSIGQGCEVKKLEPNAPPTGTGAVYDRSPDGPTHVVSLLPGDEIPIAGEQAFFQGASKDGSSISFKIGGTLYVRVDSGLGLGLEKTEKVAEGNPTYAGASNGGRYIFFVSGGDIHRRDTSNEVDAPVSSTGDSQMVNVSADGSHVYFISEEEISGEGTSGAPNLFVWTSEGTDYITTVTASDLEQTSGTIDEIPALANWTKWAVNMNRTQTGAQPGPGAESSRTTPDGSILVFESRAQLTAYDNDGHSEVYRYDAVSEQLRCVSCNPAVEPAEGDARLQELNLAGPPIVIHNLSNDGSRVFFETNEALVGADSDGVNDIYEWQTHGGEPERDLISSGASKEYPLPAGVEDSPWVPLPNVLYSITASGGDVMFLSQDALLPRTGKGGTAAIYDARVNGGFPEPSPPLFCVEEECRPAISSAAGSFPSSQSEGVSGSGNVKAKKHRRHRNHRCRHHGKRKHCQKQKSGRGRASSVPPAQAPQEAPQQVAASGDSAGSSSAATSVITAAASGEFAEFGIKSVAAALSTSTAGGHPDFTTNFKLNFHTNSKGRPEASARTEGISVDLPPGLLGNPNSVPTCEVGQVIAFASCGVESQVGLVRIKVGDPLQGEVLEPVYNVAPPHPGEEVARLGFLAALYPVFIDVKVRTAGDYGVTAVVHDPPSLAQLLEAETTLWGNPSDPQHDAERITAAEAAKCGSPATCKPPGGGRPSGLAEPFQAFVTNPAACQEGAVDFGITSYQLPGQLFTASAPLAPITDCTGLPFAPAFEAEPTSHEAGAPTGLKTKLVLPQHLGAEERATATMREARVTLPEGMQVAAGAANWIGTCSDQQVGYHEEVDTACPDSAKLGTATIKSPALSVPIEGTIYQRAPEPGRQLGLWLTADALGMHIKLPGGLEPGKNTGRLTAVFRDLPQVPVEEIDLNVWGGPRAPLQNPDHCGTFTTDFSFSPHSSDPAAAGQSTMQITEGCSQGFSPTLHAGVTDPVAGKHSPFVFDLTRPDGQQALRGFELKLPDGELAKIAGVPLCSDAAADAATCPQGSRIGSIQATTGPGPDPLTIPQAGKPEPQIYLAGPYKDAPFSIVSEVPAQAGPFDLGTLAVRSGLDVEPETGRAVVKADPLPQFFEGVGIAYRNLHAVVDRPEFNLNPTDCREMAVTSDVTSTQGTVAHPAARFQVDGCKALKFKPKLSLKLKGGTKRAAYPALTAILKARKGDANIAFTSVALPHSEFLAQEHIGTICTRKQFAADTCPKGSVYGKAKAVTPLLDKPLSGPVYLRSSDHPLPDLVAKLGGELEIDLVGRIDSVHGGIRATFESVPDAPVTKFVLQMRGGRKGLLTNSTDICRGTHKATAQMKAQNGRAATLRPMLASSGCGNKKLGKKHQRQH